MQLVQLIAVLDLDKDLARASVGLGYNAKVYAVSWLGWRRPVHSTASGT
jgi:hypothetical protein